MLDVILEKYGINPTPSMRTAGRIPAGSQAHHLVPLSDKQYVSQLEMMVATLKIPFERRKSECEIFLVVEGLFGISISERSLSSAGESVVLQKIEPLTRFDLWQRA